MSMLFASLVFGLYCTGYVRGYLSNDYALHFPNRGVSDYANIWGMRSLTQFTVCFWMQSSGTNNGAVFSYAVPGQDNELLVDNYKNFLLLIGGESRRAGISANDGQWHHICVSWRNSDGAWKFYKDGVLHHHSINFKRGYTIKAGGSLVLGQEQDGVASRFDANQCFLGTLANVNVWSYVIAPSVISSYSTSCLYGMGDVYKWTDFIHGVKGKAALVLPSPCSPPRIG